MPLNLGDVFPNFTVDTTEGTVEFHKFLGDRWAASRLCIGLFVLHSLIYLKTPFSVLLSWGVLFSHPADYTPVCTTELGVVAQLIPEFTKRGVKVIALSCDPVESHRGWIKDIQVKGISQYLLHKSVPAKCKKKLSESNKLVIKFNTSYFSLFPELWIPAQWCISLSNYIRPQERACC